MTPREVSLAALTTFGVGGPARAAVELEREADLAALRPLAQGGFFILGGGSNVLAPEGGLDALLIRVALKGVALEPLPGGGARLSLGAGEPWERAVESAAAAGLWGIENLAGIPGSAGGAAVQNIGAYGAALSEVFDYAEAFDLRSGETLRIDRAAYRPGYRDSVFKRRPELLVTRVALALRASAAANFSYRDPSRGYRDLRSFFEAHRDPSPAEVGAAVRAVRAAKFPDLAREGTAGSFFANPTLPEPEAQLLAERFPGMPLFPLPETAAMKVPLGWILDRALGLRGARYGCARVYEKHALVIAAKKGGRASDIDALARMIEQKVEEEVGLTIAREVVTMSAHAMPERT
jgi:UDP-N-acetylmuramate dehydrogenase